MSNYIKRFVPVILVLALCVTCLVFPASAASFESNNTSLIDLLDFAFIANGSGTNNIISVSGTSNKVSFNLPFQSYVSYVDCLFEVPQEPSKVKFSATGEYLTITHVSGSLYRAYGNVSPVTNAHISLYFEYPQYQTRLLEVHSCRINLSRSGTVSVPSLCISRVEVDNDSEQFTMSDPTDLISVYLEQTYELLPSEYRIHTWFTEWKKFDYIDYSFYVNATSLSSMEVTHDGNPIPYEVSYISSAVVPTDQNAGIDGLTGQDTLFYVSVRIYLDSLDKDSPYYPQVSISGTLSYLGYFGINTISGHVYTNNFTQLELFWMKLNSLLSSKFDLLLNKIDQAFGLNNDAASSAQQTQEEINVSVNNQLVGAVEDWNTNIEVVQTGYDSALTKATPALGWLASLADRVFSNMGWFGNIYFLIGLISVIMLVLSKSGLARSVSRFRRND